MKYNIFINVDILFYHVLLKLNLNKINNNISLLLSFETKQLRDVLFNYYIKAVQI